MSEAADGGTVTPIRRGVARWDIDHEVSGRANVLVNGEDVSNHVRALSLHLATGEIPRLVVEMRGEGTLSGEGIVEVVREPKEADLAQFVGQWLEQVDTDEIEAQMRDLPMSVGPIEAVLAALRNRAVSGQ